MSEANKKTILIVDDSTVVRETLKHYLKGASFDIIEAQDPKECLKILSATTIKIDLGLIDVEMPHMNGFELIEMIRAHPSYADVPFVMVTSKHDKEHVTQAIKAGACDYLGKPFKKKTLLDKIHKHLKD